MELQKVEKHSLRDNVYNKSRADYRSFPFNNVLPIPLIPLSNSVVYSLHRITRSKGGLPGLLIWLFNIPGKEVLRTGSLNKGRKYIFQPNHKISYLDPN